MQPGPFGGNGREGDEKHEPERREDCNRVAGLSGRVGLGRGPVKPPARGPGSDDRGQDDDRERHEHARREDPDEEEDDGPDA